MMKRTPIDPMLICNESPLENNRRMIGVAVGRENARKALKCEAYNAVAAAIIPPKTKVKNTSCTMEVEGYNPIPPIPQMHPEAKFPAKNK
jgi:hypothetical protein